MSDKPIIDIGVDDSAFSRFRSKFQEYRKGLKESAGDWEKVGKTLSQPVAKGVKSANDSVRRFATYTARAAASQNLLAAGASKAAGSFKTLARWSGKLALNLGSAVRSLLRILSLGGIISGLLGGAGLFGIGRLAASAGNTRREAQGFGVSAGDLRAARTNFNRYVDTDSMLGGINEAQRDLQKRWTLSSLGFRPDEISQSSPADLLPKLLPRVIDAFKRYGGTLQGAEAHGLTQFADIGTLTRLSKLSPDELSSATSQYQSDRNSLSNSDETLKKWQDLDTQLTRSGEKIKAVLIDGLSPLAPQIAALSDSFAEWLKNLLKNPELGSWIDRFAKGIERVGKYLASDEAQKDFQNAVDNVKAFGKAIGDVLRFFGYLPEKEGGQAKGPVESLKQGASNLKKDPRESWSEWSYRVLYHKEMRPQGTVAQSLGDGETDVTDAANRSQAAVRFVQLEAKYKLSPGELDKIWLAESSRGKNMLSPVGARGHFGFMPKTAKEYGLRDPDDLMESSEAAARKLSNLRRYYKGDDEKARAAYNWGEGNLDKILAKYGAEWKRQLPKETRDYVAKTETAPASSRSPLTVSIFDNTGGSVNIQSNQLAY